MENNHLPKSEQWTLKSMKSEFVSLKTEINNLEETKTQKPGRIQSLKGFFSRIGYALKLMWTEKEIFTFAVLQWTSIAIGYYLWVQMLDWIPEEVWRSAAESDEGSIADIVLFLWSFFCVGVAAFPLGIFSACMGAVHFLHKQGKPSSIAACLKLVLPNAWPLWVFHWADGWITVNQILIRLPKKKDDMTRAQKMLSEALYFAWKLGTIGILPSLVTGRGFVKSCRQSVSIVRHKFLEVAKLRLGYSALCWPIGIAAYIGSFVFFGSNPNLVPPGKTEIYSFYFWAAVPILIAVAVIQLFLRPIYVISACDIYSDYLTERQEEIVLPSPPSRGVSAFVAFLILCLVLAVVYLYRYQLGIMDMLATPYGKTYVPR